MASPHAPAPPRWQERIGGKWAISWQAYAAGAVLNVIIFSLTGGQIGAQEIATSDIWRWALLGCVAALVIGLYALVAHFTVFRHRSTHAVAPALVIGFHFGVGILFGLIAVIGGDLLIEESDQDPWVRVIVIGLIGLWWGLTSALVLEARDRFNRQRRELIDRAVEVELAALSETEAAAKLREVVTRDAGPALTTTRTQITNVLADLTSQDRTLLEPDQWRSISLSLRATADEAIRPLSHQLWEATSEKFAEPKLGRVLTRVFTYQQFAVLPSMIILVIGYLPAGIYRFGPAGGTLATLLMAAGASALLALGNAAITRLRSRGSFPTSVATVTTFLAVEIYAGAYFLLLNSLGGQGTPATSEVVGGVIAVGISVLLPAAFSSLGDTRAELLAHFSRDTDRARVRQIASAQQLAQLTRHAARELHGTVQTRLIACAAAIEQAAQSGDATQFREALETSISALDSPLGSPTDNPDVTVSHAIANVCAPWQGICDIAINLDSPSSIMKGALALSAGRAAEEAIANAVRHGLAERITIQGASDSPGELVLTIIDDGIGPTGNTAGLGTSLMTQLSNGRYTLESDAGGGARVRIELSA